MYDYRDSIPLNSKVKPDLEKNQLIFYVLLPSDWASSSRILRVWTKLGFVMSSVCYIQGLLCRGSVMSSVCYVQHLLYLPSVISSVCYLCFVMSRVCYVQCLLCLAFVISRVCFVQHLLYLLFASLLSKVCYIVLKQSHCELVSARIDKSVE